MDERKPTGQETLKRKRKRNEKKQRRKPTRKANKSYTKPRREKGCLWKGLDISNHASGEDCRAFESESRGDDSPSRTTPIRTNRSIRCPIQRFVETCWRLRLCANCMRKGREETRTKEERVQRRLDENRENRRRSLTFASSSKTKQLERLRASPVPPNSRPRANLRPPADRRRP